MKKECKVTLRGVFFASVVALGSAVSGPEPATAQELDVDERIQEVSREIGQFIADLAERNAALPETVAAIRESHERVEMADEATAAMISDLTGMTDRFDTDSEFRAVIVTFDGTMLDLIAELEVSDDEVLRVAIPGLQDRYERLRQVDRRRAEAVIEARAIIRDLEENQARIALLLRIGEIDRALDAMEATVADFRDLLTRANELAAEAGSVLASP